MAHKKIYVVAQRRKREGKTDYRKRLSLLKSHQVRLVVRCFSQHIVAQVVEYVPQGDKILVAVDSRQLQQHGWKVTNGNIPEAYLVGLSIAQKAKKLGVSSVILDTGLVTHLAGSKVYAVACGAVEGGLPLVCDKQVFPSDTRITGQHIASYAQHLKAENKQKYDTHFSRYIKAGVVPEELPKVVESVKQNITGMQS
ncbi:MAG: 50S ribosomal protein L18 [Candidatus Woesearchaeota archaeon]